MAGTAKASITSRIGGLHYAVTNLALLLLLSARLGGREAGGWSDAHTRWPRLHLRQVCGADHPHHGSALWGSAAGGAAVLLAEDPQSARLVAPPGCCHPVGVPRDVTARRLRVIGTNARMIPWMWAVRCLISSRRAARFACASSSCCCKRAISSCRSGPFISSFNLRSIRRRTFNVVDHKNINRSLR